MNDQHPICKSVERMLHQEIRTPKDFTFLRDQIYARTRVILSDTTLKRVWGYVNYDHAPSLRTLNTLAQFLGFQDYKQFSEQSPDEAPSDIVISNYIDVDEDLTEGDELTLYWLPDRECHLRYLGNNRFIVTASANTRLREGDTFSCHFIIEGEPLYLSQLHQGERPAVNYVCGKQGGVRFEYPSPTLPKGE